MREVADIGGRRPSARVISLIMEEHFHYLSDITNEGRILPLSEGDRLPVREGYLYYRVTPVREEYFLSMRNITSKGGVLPLHEGSPQ
jgi:hypothetical protein